MSNDDIIPIINAFTMAFCVMSAVIWYPIARRSLCYFSQRTMPPKIYMLGLGIVWICVATFALNVYTGSVRQFGLTFLRDHATAPILLLLQSAGFAIFSFGYMVPRESGKPNGGGAFKAGLAAGGATLVILLGVILL